MNRICLVLDETLTAGQIGNVSAILMGQAALCRPESYGGEPLLDRDGVRHAAVTCNVIVLKTNGNRLRRLPEQVRNEHPELDCVVFSRLGQQLSNSFARYQEEVRAGSASDLEPIGLLLFGEETQVRAATKRFSVL